MWCIVQFIIYISVNLLVFMFSLYKLNVCLLYMSIVCVWECKGTQYLILLPPSRFTRNKSIDVFDHPLDSQDLRQCDLYLFLKAHFKKIVLIILNIKKRNLNNNRHQVVWGGNCLFFTLKLLFNCYNF